MPRLQIDLPSSFPFSTRVSVRVDDINAGGHLAHDAVLSLAHEARMRWVRSLGFFSELDVAGAGLIMSEAMVMYRAEAEYGTELRIEVAPAQVRPATFNLFYRLSDDATGTEIARVQTGMVFFDYKTRSPRRAPDAFLAAVRGGDTAASTS